MGRRGRGGWHLTSSSPGEPARRPDASMSILVDLMANAVDEGYATAAARRGTQPVPTVVRSTPVAGKPLGLRGRAAIGAAVALALAGALFATAAVATHRGNAAATRDRKQLVAQVTLQTAATDALERQVSTLSTQVSSARTSALSLDRSRGQPACADQGARTCRRRGSGRRHRRPGDSRRRSGLSRGRQ